MQTSTFGLHCCALLGNSILHLSQTQSVVSCLLVVLLVQMISSNYESILQSKESFLAPRKSTQDDPEAIS